jgi:hypothetical protein
MYASTTTGKDSRSEVLHAEHVACMHSSIPMPTLDSNTHCSVLAHCVEVNSEQCKVLYLC